MRRFLNLKRMPLPAIDTAEGDSLSIGGGCEFEVSDATAAGSAFQRLIPWLKELQSSEPVIASTSISIAEAVDVPETSDPFLELNEPETLPTDSPGLLDDPRTGAESAEPPSHDAQDPSEDEDVVADADDASGEAEQLSGEDGATPTKRKKRRARKKARRNQSAED